MITIFTCPKPFTDPHIRMIQRNAIQSWMQYSSVSEIISLGEAELPADLKSESRIRHIEKIERNEYGTPLVSSIFQQAENASNNNVLAYINPDIILLDDIGAIVSKLHNDKFLMLGLRWNLDVSSIVNFEDSEWARKLWEEVACRGEVYSVQGVDYYVFTKGCFGKIPPFAVGRTSYDNWLIWRALSRGAELVDATDLIRDIHQNHDRTYSALGLNAPGGVNDLTRGVEAAKNRAMAEERIFDLNDCRYSLTCRGLRAFRDHEHVYRRVERMSILSPKLYKLIPGWKLKYALAWLFPRF